MRCSALACDYDGTLATAGRVDPVTLRAVERLRESGRRFVLVTGRPLGDLHEVFPDLGMCDRVVAENGAIVFRPDTCEEVAFAGPPDPRWVARLRELQVAPLSVGRVIVATTVRHEASVRAASRELGLELEIIFNKGALLALPRGIDKATGLSAALEELGLSPYDTVAVGDAENDRELLATCGLGVAVANALSSLKGRARWVTPSAEGRGVSELIDRMLASDECKVAQPAGRGDLRPPLGARR